MAKQDRETLKDKFKNGKIPSEKEFADLIDSMLNKLDEGFDKTPADGLKVSQLLNTGKLISFYQNITVESSMWHIGLGQATKNLQFGNQHNQNVLTLRSQKNIDAGSGLNSRIGVGINTDNPQYELDVAGTIASHGRVGKKGEMAIPADGGWYDITDTLSGCHAFEVMAGVGGSDSDGKYALTHAFALNTFNAKSDISYHRTHYGSKCNRIELRWQRAFPTEETFQYKLQMRVECTYGDDVWIKYYITQLWFDTLMRDSTKKPSTLPKPSPAVKKPAKG
jgi:hypothetical protein